MEGIKVGVGMYDRQESREKVLGGPKGMITVHISDSC